MVRLEERTLLKRHLEGDRTAFPELVRQYRAPVYAYLLRCGLEPAAADDLFQESFLKVHRGAASYSADRPLKPWIFTIVANTVRSHFRKRNVPLATGEDAGVDDVPDPAPTSHDIAEAAELEAWLEQALLKLPVMQRQVVMLCCIERIEQKDVATALELPLNTVKTHLRRARLALARALTRHRARGRREVAS